MTIGLITTSRADYGIYTSLLEQLRADPEIDYGLLVTGSHLSAQYGYTLQQILDDGHPIYGQVEIVPATTEPVEITTAIGRTIAAFATVWDGLAQSLDLIIALGDRYEMFAAVTASVPYNIPVAHLHGGETTLGAIDDKFRHALTVMATLHFTSTPAYAERVASIAGKWEGIYSVGAPSLDGLSDLVLPSIDEVREKFNIDFSLPTILVTVHPETVAIEENKVYAKELSEAFGELTERYQLVINLPNADTQAKVLRSAFVELASHDDRVITLENFGKRYYFAAMKYASLLIGNSSSALLEAPSFGKYAINVGNRQKGRERSANVLDVEMNRLAIAKAVRQVEAFGYHYSGANIYVKDGRAGQTIVAEIKNWFRTKPVK